MQGLLELVSLHGGMPTGIMQVQLYSVASRLGELAWREDRALHGYYPRKEYNTSK